MKKIISIFLSFTIVFLSVSTCIPISVCADTDKTVLSKSSDSPFAYSSSEAQKYVSAHLDIYDSDNTLLFSYTPTSTYNWTYSSKGKDNLHLSDNQLKAFLMSKKTLSAYAQLMLSGFSNNNVTRGFLSALGIATTGNSNALTDVSDKLLGNYNYIDSINYDEDTQTITMDNTSVDKLREEIKQYYYDSIGIVKYKASGNFSSYINSRDFTHLFEYDEDLQEAYNKISKYKYALCDRYRLGSTNTSEHSFLWDSSDYLYLSEADGYVGRSTGNWCSRLMSYSNNMGTNFVDTTVSYTYYGISSGSYSTFSSPVTGLFWNPKGSYYNYIYPCSSSEKTNIIVGGREYSVNAYEVFQYFPFEYYSYDGSPLLVFKSFSSMYNYLNGDQNAFLSSEIKKTGEDITFSIKDMNENLGNKMDTLIDSINSNKSNMSADELQNAIDKGLEDLNKNTEDIKDNTSDILEVLKEQNQILLDILGVTKHIADSVDDIDENANFSSLMSLLSTVFLGIQNAILYGQNTMDNDNNTDAQAAVYDDDEIAVYSSGGGTSLDYRGGIFGHFPFSVIYHLYDWLKVLQTEPKCPEFSYNYGFMIGRKDDTECQITFDLSQYESWRDVISSFMKLSFTLAIAVGTYKKFKGGDLS